MRTAKLTFPADGVAKFRDKIMPDTIHTERLHAFAASVEGHVFYASLGEDASDFDLYVELTRLAAKVADLTDVAEIQWVTSLIMIGGDVEYLDWGNSVFDVLGIDIAAEREAA